MKSTFISTWAISSVRPFDRLTKTCWPTHLQRAATDNIVIVLLLSGEWGEKHTHGTHSKPPIHMAKRGCAYGRGAVHFTHARQNKHKNTVVKISLALYRDREREKKRERERRDQTSEMPTMPQQNTQLNLQFEILIGVGCAAKCFSHGQHSHILCLLKI